jgi:sulfur carrier protein ThiS
MKLYLGSYFAFFTPDHHHWVELEIPHPTQLTDILSELGVPAAEVYLVVVNDQALETTDTLVSNDNTVRLYPPTNGG